MAETYSAFKGFKIVHYSTWENLTPEKKKGYLWFVRTGDVNDKSVVTKGDIYFGTRHYGQYDPTNASDIDELKKVLGNIPGLSGKPGIPADKKTVADIIEHIAKPYSAGSGITISENKVIASNTNATTVSDITIAGGPINATGIFEGNKIPSGTSVQEILTKLLCKEIFPDAATKPTITVTASGAPSGFREINSTLTIPAFTTSTNAGQFNPSPNGTHTQPVTGSNFSNIKFTTTKSGFTNYEIAADVTTIAQQTGITVSEGTNSVTCNVTGNYTKPTGIPVTNLGNQATGATYTFTAGTATNSTKVSVTGVYPIYSNGTQATGTGTIDKPIVDRDGPTKEPNDPKPHSLISPGSTVSFFFAAQELAPYTIYIPKGKYTITVAKVLNPTTHAYDSDVSKKFTAAETVTLLSGGKGMDYIAYKYTGSNGPNCVQFTIGNA